MRNKMKKSLPIVTSVIAWGNFVKRFVLVGIGILAFSSTLLAVQYCQQSVTSVTGGYILLFSMEKSSTNSYVVTCESSIAMTSMGTGSYVTINTSSNVNVKDYAVFSGDKKTLTITLTSTTAPNFYTKLDIMYGGTLAQFNYPVTNITWGQCVGVPFLTTTAATAVGNEIGTMNGNISYNRGSIITSYGFYWSTTNGFADGAGTQVVKGTTNFSGDITHVLSGLTNGTLYYYKAYATNSSGTAYGAQMSFIPRTMYYSKSTGNLDVLSNWGTAIDGSGDAPADFTSNNVIYNIVNNTAPTIGATWTVGGTGSQIIVGNGTVACNFTIPSGFSLITTSPAVVNVSNLGTLTIGNATIPTLGTLAAGSTVEYNLDAAQTITAVTYANLIISGAGTKTLAGATNVSAALTVKEASTLALSTYTLGAITRPTSLTMEMGATEGAKITGTGVLSLGGNVTVSKTGAVGASITAPIALIAARTFTIADGAAANDISISGIISGGFGITKTGAGTMQLSGVNTFSGSVTISVGTLKLGASSTVNTSSPTGTSGAITVTNGASLDMNGFSYTSGHTQALTLNGTGVGGLGALTNSSSTTSTYIGPITFGTTASSIFGEAGLINITGIPVSSTNPITLGGSAGGSVSTVIAGVRTLTKAGTGIWTLSGTNTYTGATTISAGELRLNPSANTTNLTPYVLNGGTLSTTSITAARTITASTLQLNQNSTIALGSNSHTLTFAASNGVTWAGTTLTITGWTGTAENSGTAGKIFFGAANSTLTSDQLAKITFSGISGSTGAKLLSTGELVPAAILISTPTVTSTAAATSISTTTATSGGNVTAEGTSAVTARGVCWSTSPSPTVDLETKTVNGSGIGTFTSNITGLSQATTYYVRSYATNTSGTSYGGEISFTTLDEEAPTAFTANVGAITMNSVELLLNATDNSGSINYTISYGSTNLTTTGTSGVQKSFIVTGLTDGTSYTFSVIAKDATLNAAANNPFVVSATTTTLSTIDFETVGQDWTWETAGNGTTNAPLAFVDNPSPTTINSSAKVAKFQADANGQSWALIFSSNRPYIVSANNKIIKVMVYKDRISDFGVKLEISTGDLELIVPNTVINQWQILTFDFSSKIGSTVNKLVIIPDFLARATNTINHFDNISFSSGVLGAPTIGTATAGNAQASVAFTAPASNGGTAISGYTVTSSPAGGTKTGTSSPLVVTGLDNGTAYTFTVTATNAQGTGAASLASNEITPHATTNIIEVGTSSSVLDLTLTPVSDLKVLNGVTLTGNAAKTVNSITVESGGKLNVSSGSPLVVGTLTFKADKDASSFSSKLDAGITATSVRLFKTIDDTKWYFMSFPCAVTVTDIKKSDGESLGEIGVDWFIKYYDGNKRSTDGVSNGSNWVSVLDGTLNTNRGYIIGLKTGKPETEILFPLNTAILAAETESTVPVLSYSSGTAGVNHLGWNLVGQPYLSKYNANTNTSAPSFMVMPNPDGKTYTVTSKVPPTLPEVHPFAAYFVQSASDGNISFALTSRQNAPSSVANNVSENVQLNVSTATGVDNTYLIMDNDQTTDYQIGEDMEKWIGTGTDKPQIYTLLGGINYAFNALPMNNVVNLPVGFYSKTSGNSTISVNASQAPSLSKLLLIDISNGTTTDLLTSNYNFIADAGTDNSRFVITAQRVSTDNNLIESGADEPIITMVNGKLSMVNLTPSSVIRVYDATGRLVVSKTANNSSLEIPLTVVGLYTVQIGTQTKNWKRKIINKK